MDKDFELVRERMALAWEAWKAEPNSSALYAWYMVTECAFHSAKGNHAMALDCWKSIHRTLGKGN